MSQYHHSDAITSVMASQITSLTIVYSSVYSDADQRKHQSSASLACCEGYSPLTGEFPAQRASNPENVSIWWHLHDTWFRGQVVFKHWSILPGLHWYNHTMALKQIQHPWRIRVNQSHCCINDNMTAAKQNTKKQCTYSRDIPYFGLWKYSHKHNSACFVSRWPAAIIKALLARICIIDIETSVGYISCHAENICACCYMNIWHVYPEIYLNKTLSTWLLLYMTVDRCFNAS